MSISNAHEIAAILAEIESFAGALAARRVTWALFSLMGEFIYTINHRSDQLLEHSL